jgi:two-component system response regulator YesN
MYRLLIADDEIVEREAIKFIVAQNLPGLLEISEAANGRELLEKLNAAKPDIVLTDIKMPGINGLEAAAKIRALLPECRIILMSAFHYFDYAKDGLVLGADDYITKPAPVDVIVNALNQSILHLDEAKSRRKREEETNTRLKNVTQYLEEELISIMSSGEIDENVIREFFEMLDIQSNGFVGVALMIPCHDLPIEIAGEVQKRILKKRLSEHLKNKLHARGFNFLQSIVGQYIFILMFDAGGMEEYASRVLWAKTFSEIKDEILVELLIPLNIGIGNQCNAVTDIHQTFLQAKIALKYDATPGTVISYGDIEKPKKSSEYPMTREKQLLNRFLSGETEDVLRIADELIDWISANLPGLDIMKQKVYELLLVLLREAVLNLHLQEFATDSESMRRDVFSLGSTRELRSYVKGYIQKQLLEVRRIKASRANSLLSLVTEYIQKSYDREVSLESAAEMVRISPFYLSRLFRKETGVTFIDYLTEYRMKRARELLSVPTNNVKEVCYRVGYKDPNYFARVFKKVSGMTPTEYRDRMIQIS